MSVFRAKIWTGVSAAVVLSAGGLAACSGEGGEAGANATADAGPTGTAAAGGEGEGGEAGATPAGGEGEGGEAGTAAVGEQGASSAYAAVPVESRQALRLGQLGGFFLAAKAVGAAEGPDAAAALAGQGLLEAFDPAKAELTSAGLNEAVLRKAAQTGAPADLNAAIRAVETAQGRAGGDPAAVARGLTALSVGLYREAAGAGGLDPIEYQHAYGQALAAQALVAREGKLAPAKTDIDRLVRLWPSASAPEDAARAPKLAEVQAQASRVELALSGV